MAPKETSWNHESLFRDHQAMDEKVTLRLDGSPRMTAGGILDHPDITLILRPVLPGCVAAA
jgi:hypothetical protein